VGERQKNALQTQAWKFKPEFRALSRSTLKVRTWTAKKLA
jgi:hypothetical protein